ncbi:ATP phosphoribosyltransferase [Candidatus Hodgkinia cicadicola]|uniref:ATP phosphoribosyltransferase n=1 Tax=Candidatus Hodgkinia cicadicola TaxID=573658 RepID=A0ABX4MGR8_9HYPH|nr:ATP phosphoribosyltransferase [Candidatus Hodgkinia cicadicola]PIM96102.1 ATP phosphoribosyltransferase [Candidatus Hodgkinia cicadicola]
MSAPNIASELTSGNLSFGLTGLDLILETNNKHIKLLKTFNQSQANLNLLTPLSWSKSLNLPPLRLCLTPILSTKYQQISKHYITTKNIKQLHVTKSKSTTEIEPFVGISNIIIDITSSGSTAKTNLLNSSPTSLILTSTLCMFYNQTYKISSKINTLIHILCHLLTSNTTHNSTSNNLNTKPKPNTHTSQTQPNVGNITITTPPILFPHHHETIPTQVLISSQSPNPSLPHHELTTNIRHIRT